MNSDFLVYVQKLELMTFFLSYPMIYTIILFFSGDRTLIKRIFSLLPLSYAVTGTLFLGYQLRKLYPDYSIEHIKLIIHLPYLVMWGLLSILFWIPALLKRAALSLIHSLVFFFFLASDLFVQIISTSADDNIIKNDMKVYASSILLSLGILTLLLLLSFSFDYYKKHLTYPKKNGSSIMT
jgi:hypothetical protein